MPTRITTPAPLFEAPDLRNWLRVDDSSEDALIAELIHVATSKLDGPYGDLCVQIADATYEERFQRFDSQMPLGISPVSEIVSITYVDPAGATQNDDPAHWEIVDIASSSWAVLARRDKARPFPLVSTTAHFPVKVRFIAGFGAPSDVPPVLRHVVRMTVASMYDMRESTRFGTGGFVESPEAKAMLSAYRRGLQC